MALNTFAFAAWMKFIAFTKSEHLSTKVRDVELLFWSSDFCVSPVISAETIQLQGGPKLTWCRAWYTNGRVQVVVSRVATLWQACDHQHAHSSSH